MALLMAITRPVMTGISCVSGRTMPPLVWRLLSSLRMTTRLPMGSMTSKSNSGRLLPGLVDISTDCSLGARGGRGLRVDAGRKLLPGPFDRFPHSRHNRQDRVEPAAAEQLFDHPLDAREDEPPAALLHHPVCPEEHRDGGRIDEVDFGQVDHDTP